MHKSTIVLAMLMAASASAFGAKIEMSGPIEFPNAGITLAVPRSFQLRRPGGPYVVLQAMAVKDKQLSQVIALSAVAVPETFAAEKLAETALADLKKNPAVRDLEVLKKRPMPFGELIGEARLVRYTYRDENTIRADVCVARDLTSPRLRMCYMLSVESTEEYSDQVLPILGEIIKSISLTALRRPIELPIRGLGPPIEDPAHGYSIRPPLRWFAALTPAGLIAGHTDYLHEQTPLPRMQVAAGEVPAGTTSEACAKYWIERAQQGAREKGLDAEVLAEGPARLAGKKAYQFFVMTSGKTEATSKPAVADEPTIIAQRTLCVKGFGDKDKSYSLVLVYPGRDYKVVRSILDKLARNFSLVTRPKTSKTTSTAPAKK